MTMRALRVLRLPSLGMTHAVPTKRGANLPYRQRRFDWSIVFADLLHGSTIADVAKAWQLPRETVRRRWHQYQQAVAADDVAALAVARGDLDGRRDNNRKFTREEEAILRSQLANKENANPNFEGIRRMALRIHEEHETSAADNHTRSAAIAKRPFAASDKFVERIKRDLRLSSQKPKYVRRNVRVKGPEVDERREVECVEFVDEVHRSVLRNGARFVINVDEISCNIIHLPHTLLAPVGGAQPPLVRSNHSDKEAVTMIYGTTPSGAKLKPAVIISPRGERAMRAFAHLTDRVHILQGYRWFGVEMWLRYIEQVIVPFCDGHPATLIVDSLKAHINELSALTAMEHNIYCMQVPKGMTAQLQPNDVLAWQACVVQHAYRKSHASRNNVCSVEWNPLVMNLFLVDTFFFG